MRSSWYGVGAVVLLLAAASPEARLKRQQNVYQAPSEPTYVTYTRPDHRYPSTMPVYGSITVNLFRSLSQGDLAALPKSIVVTAADGRIVPGTVGGFVTGNELVFSPRELLEPNAEYTVAIQSTAQGGLLAQELVFKVKTEPLPSNIYPPSNPTPAPGAKNVDVTTVVSVVLQGPSPRQWGGGAQVYGVPPPELVPVTQPNLKLYKGDVEVPVRKLDEACYGGTGAVFRPATPLEPNATYTAVVEIATTGVKYRGGTSEVLSPARAAYYRWSFTTGARPTEGPKVTSISPLSVGQRYMYVEFSQPLDPATVNPSTVIVRDEEAGTVVPGSLTYGANAPAKCGSTAVKVPISFFAAQTNPNRTYVVTITTGVKNLLGVPMAQTYTHRSASGGPIDWDTGVKETNPPNGARNVSPATPLQVRIDSDFDCASLKPTSFEITAYGARAGAVGQGTAGCDGNVVTFTPSQALAANTSFTVAVSGLKKATGGEVSRHIWSFTTAAAPPPAPPGTCEPWAKFFDRCAYCDPGAKLTPSKLGPRCSAGGQLLCPKGFVTGANNLCFVEGAPQIVPGKKKKKGGIAGKVKQAIKSVVKALPKPVQQGIKSLQKTVNAFIGKDLRTFIKSPGKILAKVTKGVKMFVKNPKEAVKGALQRVVKNVKEYAKKIKKLIIGPILAKFRQLLAKAFGPVIKAAMPLIKKFITPILEKSAGHGGQFGVDSLERWAGYLRGGQLDKARIQKEIFDRIEAWVGPKLRNKVDAVIGFGLSFIRQYADAAVQGAIGSVGSIPLVGWLLVAVLSEGYNFLMAQLQQAVTEAIYQEIKRFAKKIFDKTAGKLLGKLIPKINLFLKRTGIGETIATLLEAVSGGKAKVERMVQEAKAKSTTWTAAIEGKLRDAAMRLVVSQDRLSKIGKPGAPAGGGR